jgi:hypothetical protein
MYIALNIHASITMHQKKIGKSIFHTRYSENFNALNFNELTRLKAYIF